MLYRLLVCTLLLVLISACSHKTDQHNHEQHDHQSSEANANHDDHDDNHDAKNERKSEHEKAHLAFSQAYLARFETEFQQAQSGVLTQVIELPGVVELDSDQVAHISPRFPAKIKQVYAKIGDTVKAGDNLALAESSETLARFNLISLIDGTIINRHIAQGEHLQPDDTAFVVANLNQVWVDMTIYPHLLDQIKVGQSVTINKRNSEVSAKASIDYIAPVVNTHTRSGLARVFLDNKHGQWKPGSFVNTAIATKQITVDISVPNSALIELEGQPHIFAQHENEWEATPVKLGTKGDTSTEVLSGLKQGQTYVSKGAFLLKAQLEKSEFESGHNH